jgi:GxxExxY protein
MRQVPVSVRYEDLVIDGGFRADLIVERKVIVELKSVERTAPVHNKQTLTYVAPRWTTLGPPDQLRRGAHQRRHHSTRQRPRR